MNTNSANQAVAKSDYIISVFRHILDDPLDSFESPAFESSFNSAFLVDGRIMLTIVFYPSNQIINVERSDQRVARFKDMVVAGYWRTDSRVDVPQTQFEATASRGWNEYTDIQSKPFGIKRLLLKVSFSSAGVGTGLDLERMFSSVLFSDSDRIVLQPSYGGTLHDDAWRDESEYWDAQSEINIVYEKPMPYKAVTKSFAHLGLPISKNPLGAVADVEPSGSPLTNYGITRIQIRGRYY